jgi:hypothetical protein
VSRGHKTVATVVPFAAEHAHAHVLASRNGVPNSIGSLAASGFHKLQTWDAMALGCKAVYLAHFGSG